MTAAILLSIPGTIGKILLIILLVILALIALLLFFPFCYRATLKKEEGDGSLQAKLSWMFVLLQLRAEAAIGSDGVQRPEVDLRFFGIPILRLLRRRREAQRTGGRGAGPRPAKTGGQREGTYTGAKIRPSVVPRAERPAEVDVEIYHRSKPSPFLRLGAKISAVIGKIKAFFSRCREIFTHIGEFLEFIRSEQFSRGVRVLKREGVLLLKHVKPRRVTGRLTFGFDDPSTTGKVLAALGIIFPVLPQKLVIEPVFEEERFTADIQIGGHFFGIILLVRALKVLLNRDVRALFRRFRSAGPRRTKDDTETMQKAG